MTFDLPKPGGPHMDNLIATMLRTDAKNRRGFVNLDLIAKNQGFDPAEFEMRFGELQTLWDRAEWERTTQPQNVCEDIDGGK